MRIGRDCHLDGQKQYYGGRWESGSEIAFSLNFKTSSKKCYQHTGKPTDKPTDGFTIYYIEPFSKRIILNKKEGAKDEAEEKM